MSALHRSTLLIVHLISIINCVAYPPMRFSFSLSSNWARCCACFDARRVTIFPGFSILPVSRVFSHDETLVVFATTTIQFCSVFERCWSPLFDRWTRLNHFGSIVERLSGFSFHLLESSYVFHWCYLFIWARYRCSSVISKDHNVRSKLRINYRHWCGEMKHKMN